MAFEQEIASEEDQQDVNAGFLELTRKGAYALLSNSDTEYTAELYDYEHREDIKVDLIKAARSINSKASGRGKINEFLVSNYTPATPKRPQLKGYKGGRP